MQHNAPLEEWRDIPNFIGLYQVSNLGQIKSLKNNTEVIVEQSYNNGYYSVSLHNKGGVHYYVHRLVATVFIDNPSKLHIVHHIDGDKCNNTVDNLMWTTIQEHTKKHRWIPPWKRGIDLGRS